MNREQIINALECWSKNFDGKVTDFVTLCQAILLITELTEENARLRAEVSVKKKLLDKCVSIEDKVRADTVRKMKDR